MSVKSILVSQPRPENEKSPYFSLAEKYKLKIDFRSFIHVEGINGQDFRKERINLTDHTGIILTSRNAVDHYFRIAEEMRFTVPDSMKYFCISEAVAYYLQKYVVYRKRKIFHGNRTIADMTDILKKNKNEKFLVPCSDIQRKVIPQQLEALGLNFTNATLYKTVCSDLSDLEDVKYDMLVFFSPSGIESLFKNFPEFKQEETRLAVFGPTTMKSVKDNGLRADILAPNKKAPSMLMALDQYIKEANKRRR